MKSPRVKARRGRPPKQRTERDSPTPEHAMKRASLVGPDGDPVLAEYPLGVLFARRKITQDEHDAGLRYAALYGRVFGRTVPGPRNIPPELSEALEEACERKWRDAADVLMAHSRKVKDAVENVVVFGRPPLQIGKFRAMQLGLIALAAWFDKGERRAA